MSSQSNGDETVQNSPFKHRKYGRGLGPSVNKSFDFNLSFLLFWGKSVQILSEIQIKSEKNHNSDS